MNFLMAILFAYTSFHLLFLIERFLTNKKNLLIFFISLLYDFHMFQHTSLFRTNIFQYSEQYYII